jgi:mono/diheme cytochrome c family protein
MKPPHPILTLGGLRRLPVPGLVLAAGLLAGSAHAAGDPVAGRLLYESTVDQVGGPFNCADCHFTRSAPGLDRVVDRRREIGGSEFAVITEAQARGRIGVGLNERDMAPFRTLLSPQNLDDLAAYIADTPKLLDPGGALASGTAVFPAGSVGANVFREFTLTHSVATSGNLVLNTIAVTANSNFLVTGGSCTAGMTLQPGGQCRVQVAYKAVDSARRNATLTLSLSQQGAGFTRTAALAGEVAGVTPPGGGASLNPNPSGDGGGRLGLGMLAALAAAVAAARRSRRPA